MVEGGLFLMEGKGRERRRVGVHWCVDLRVTDCADL